MRQALLVFAIAVLTTTVAATLAPAYNGSLGGQACSACPPVTPVTVAQACPTCPAPVPVAACPTCPTVAPAAVCPTCPAPVAACPTCPVPATACSTCPTGVWKWHSELAPVAGACTTATGNADFQLNKECTAVRYWVNVSCINCVQAAHIRMACAGEPAATAPIVATLYLGSPKDRAMSGRLARGNIEACDLTGPLAGQPLSALTAALSAGQAFVTVDSQQHPCGEIAGGVALSQAPC
jgi:hypothetical protein